MEDFAKIIAYEDAEPSEAAYRVGYGRESHPVRDQYHINMASRLLRREDVQLRIHTLREQNSNKDKDFKTSMIDDLKRIIKFDIGQYYKSSNVTLHNGRTVTDYYFGIMLSLTLGMIVYIVFFELLNHVKHQNKKNNSIGIIIGAVLILISLIFHRH